MKSSLKLIGGQKIEGPKSSITRPTTLKVREALFNIVGNNVINSYWLDLFSGSGAVACEAYNHGAKKILAIEKNRFNADICRKNLLSLNDAKNRVDDIKVICRDIFIWMNDLQKTKNNLENLGFTQLKFDFVYIDPPYSFKKNFEILNKIFHSSLISKNTIVIYEHSKFEDIKNSLLWEIKDIRLYGQTKLSFLIKV